MNNIESIGVSFFGLSDKDRVVFDRVIEFIKKKGKNFHVCSTPDSADLFIINDHPDAILSAQEYHQSQYLLIITDDGNCSVGDYCLKRPLLITRVMRAIDESGKECQSKGLKNSNVTTAPTVENLHPNNVALKTAPTALSALAAQSPTPQTTAPPPSRVTATVTPEIEFQALIVDDSAAIRKQLEIELRGTNIHPEYAVSGEEALEKIGKKQYDLIFLDIIMPGINGYEVCKTLRKKPNYKRTPVIMLSGKTGPLDEVEGILAGASTYLLKPVKHKDFQKTLTRISNWLNDYA